MKFFILLSSLLTLSLWSADQDDIYAELHAAYGLNQDRKYLLSANIGYCPWDEWGLGLVVEQGFASKVEDPDATQIRVGPELRWFLEPFELSGDLTLLSRNDRSGVSRSSVMFSVSASYLFAISSSLALKTVFQTQFPDARGAQVYGGVGARLLY